MTIPHEAGMTTVGAGEARLPWGAADDDAPVDVHGLTRLGHYVVLEKLGQGGMGVVFAAFDTRLDRKVALKVLRAPDGEQGRLRILREAQAMARVSHPNVVQVYEIGEQGPLAYLVLEFVEGRTLSAWLAEGPRGLAEIVAVFDAAGRGLAAAHEKGLVHRDFKPDNLMIRRDGQVLVMDFGLARGDPRAEPGTQPSDPTLTHPSSLELQLTQAGAVIGTPIYMAPEQFAALTSDARTDQFSFCVALWEALYRQRPFHGDNIPALAHAVLAGRITQPERGDVPAWLHRVLVRGLAVDPAQRWPTMPALLAALSRDPGRRRRGLLIAGGLVALAGMLLGGGLLWRARERQVITDECARAGQQIAAEWNDEVATRLERAFTASGVGFAASAWTHTRPWIDAYTRDWAELRAATCLETHLERTRDPVSHDALVECLDERRTRLAGLLAGWAHADRRAVTGATTTVAELTPPSTCASALLAARMLAPAAVRVEVAALRARLAGVHSLRLAGQQEQALVQAQALATEADQLAWRPLQAEVALELGWLHARVGKYEAARDAHEQAFFHALAGGDDPSMLTAATELTHNVGYGLAQYEQGRRWGAIGEMLIERLGLAGTLRASTLVAAIGGVQTTAGRYDEALGYFRRALADKEALLGPNHPAVARMLNSIGVVLYKRGEPDGAIASFRRSLAIEEAALGPDHPDIAHSLNNLAALLGVRGDVDEALRYHDRALNIRSAALGTDHPDVAGSLGNIGILLAQKGDHAGALAHEHRALEIFTATLGPQHPELAVTHAAIAGIHDAMGAHDDALVSHQAALVIREATFGPEHPEVARSLHDLARTHLRRSEPLLALPGLRRALAIQEAALGRDNFEVGRTLVSLGWAQLELGERTGARVSLTRAAALCASGGPTVLAEAHRHLARLDAPDDRPAP